MSRPTPHPRLPLLLTLLLSASALAAAPTTQPAPPNLALHKPATASSCEGEDFNAAKANDGNADSSWCADDDGTGQPEFWQVDLQQTVRLTACLIRFPYDGHKYQYKLEASPDSRTWTLLSDQTQNTLTTQTHSLQLNSAPTRYVRITLTAVDDGCWPSLSELQLFGQP